MCRWLEIGRSGYYAWKTRSSSATAVWRQKLSVLVRTVFQVSDGTYGYRRIGAQLRRQGEVVCDEVVRRIMREQGLVPCQPVPWRPTTTITARCVDLPDLVGRDFTAPAPYIKLVGDITYIRTWEGWVYLATVLDCYSKKVLGYAMADHMRAELVCDAMRMARRNTPTDLSNALFHSDRGVQYMSAEFQRLCDRLGVVRSVGKTGVCWDNAWAESFNGTLKNERCNRTRYPTRRHAIQDVTRYIELRYNQTRLHSSIGYATPNEVETAWWDSRKAA